MQEKQLAASNRWLANGIPVSGQTHRKKTKVIHLTISAWDMCTLIPCTDSIVTVLGQLEHYTA